MTTPMRFYMRWLLAWVLASLVTGLARVFSVLWLGVWSTDGRLAIPAWAYAMMQTVQIALTGVLTFVIMGVLMTRYERDVMRSNHFTDNEPGGKQ